jgi:hypothetical protein
LIPSPETIVEGESAMLEWQSGGLDNVFLDGKQIVVTGTKEVKPDVSTTYTLSGTNILTDTSSVMSTTATISVSNFIYETITFGTFPNGNYVPIGHILNGDEFKAKGVEFTIDKVPTTCKKKNDGDNNGKIAKKAAIGVAVDTGGTPYLTTFLPKVVPACDDCAKICESVPISIKFLEHLSVRDVTLTFLHPTNSVEVTYGKNITATAPLNVRLKMTFPYTNTNITKVEVGLDEKQPPQIIKIEYYYVLDE